MRASGSLCRHMLSQPPLNPATPARSRNLDPNRPLTIRGENHGSQNLLKQKQICMSKNDISEDTLQNITKGVTFSQSISSIFRVTFSLAVDSPFYQPLCQYLAGIFPRSRQINLKPPLTIAWDQPGTT